LSLIVRFWSPHTGKWVLWDDLFLGQPPTERLDRPGTGLDSRLRHLFPLLIDDEGPQVVGPEVDRPDCGPEVLPEEGE